MKIYEVGGRKVWLDKAPDGYVEPKKAEPTTESKAISEPANKARKAPSNKAKKTGAKK